MKQVRRAAFVVVLMSTAFSAIVLLALPQFGPWSALVNLEHTVPPAHEDLNTPAAIEGCPAISPNSRVLYFASNRPHPANPAGTLDIWRSERVSADEAWGQPEPLASAVNKSDANEFCPTPLRDGKTLLFVSTKTGGCGMGDLYMTREHPVQGWSEPAHFPCSLNSSREEAGPSLVEYDDGTVELYFSSNRSGGFSTAAPDTDSDIYMSTLRNDGTFGAVLLVPGVNSAADDLRPHVRRDGLELFFDSNRPGSTLNAAGAPSLDIWTAMRFTPAAPWSSPALVPEVNTPANEARPFLSWDAKQLFVGSTQAGSFDLYVSTRDKNPQTGRTER